MALLVLFVLLIALGLAAWRWGHDSRDGRDWRSPSTEFERPEPIEH